MGYDAAGLNQGDIILISSGGVIADLIHWITVNPFNHAVLVGDGVLIEALLHVSESPLDKYQSTGWVYRAHCTEEQTAKAVAAARSKLGQFYGWEDVAYDLGRDLLHAPVTHWIRGRHLDCSALVWWSYYLAGVNLTHAPIPSPADLSYSPLLLGPRPWEQAPGRIGD